jgi:nitrate/nitrite-specific signal transduction histidine kinase
MTKDAAQHRSWTFYETTKLKKRHEELAVLYDIGSGLTRSLSLTEILDRAILKVLEHFKVDAVRI